MIGKPKPIFDYVAEHGEGPIWDSDLKKFVWVDLLQGRFIEGSWDSQEISTYDVLQPVGVLTLEKNNQSILALRDGFAMYDKGTNKCQLITPSPIVNDEAVRFNDGMVGPDGKFYAGTMEWEGKAGRGALYRLNHDLTQDKLDDGLSIPNGMGWNRSETHFFMIDTYGHCMYRYCFDKESGQLSDKEVFIEFGNDDFPDGMTIDAEDHFWIAMWGGCRLEIYSSDGCLIDKIGLPVPHPTSCTFGGSNLDQLFITSSKLLLDKSDLNRYPLSGRCFIVDTDHKGKKECSFG